MASFCLGGHTLAGSQPPSCQADVLIVGAGITGLSAALEAANAGARVLVVERSSVWGGHAVVSAGAVSIVATPLQVKKGVQDNSQLAAEDFRTWGEDADPDWVRYYAEHSREQIYTWLSGLGVIFDNVIQPDGNRVPRLHQARGKGIGLVGPLYRACLSHPKVRFLWNTDVGQLQVQDGRVTGVGVKHLRSGQKSNLRAGAVILATGGFQSNLDMVRAFWPKHLPKPPRLLLGAGHDAIGDGHRLAQQAGASWDRMDHQWNYALGLPDPRDPSGRRGLAAFNPASIWVSQHGKRFTNEFAGAKHSLPALLAQPGAAYWAVFDEGGKPSFKVTLAGWEDFRELERVIFANPKLVLSAHALAGC
ncbi:MAG: FAD-dependent oxidoreductase [Candidatus Saccharimonas sp.]|nr:FAD-dependent oxidoreductase [Planctomycetaceae bacterium]